MHERCGVEKACSPGLSAVGQLDVTSRSTQQDQNRAGPGRVNWIDGFGESPELKLSGRQRGTPVTEQQTSVWETLKAESANVIEKLKDVIREGNVRRVVIKQGNTTIAEFPLTVGVVGAVLAPILAAIGALVALVKDCTIHVERGPRTAEDRTQSGATQDVDLI
jgi:hypothetical protein